MLRLIIANALLLLQILYFMLFNSFSFIYLFPLICLGYFVLPLRFRRVFLLLTSYLLYLSWKPVFGLVLLSVTLITYFFARNVEATGSRRTGNFVALGGACTLLLLLFFKYYNFLNESILSLLSFCGVRLEFDGLNWAIPVGISFFTFQAYGYLMDVYHKRIPAERDFLTYALFVSFFPQILSGPISKAKDLMPQLKDVNHPFVYKQAVGGLKMLLWGMFMKVVVADRLGVFVDTAYAAYAYQGGLTLLFTSFAYTIQIYGDFAGYSLMAIGTAKVLGFNLVQNFNRPYLATGITDFWRRWHISLSVWLRDYVYIPLGGSRCAKGRSYWNILITFFVSGLWHGANWTFIVWGLLHGLFQVVEKMCGWQKSTAQGMRKLGRILVTFLLINIAWIFFRLPSLGEAWEVCKRILTMHSGEKDVYPTTSHLAFMLIGVLLLVGKELRDEFFPGRFPLFENRYLAIRWAGYLFVLFLILLIGVFDSGQFIYVSF